MQTKDSLRQEMKRRLKVQGLGERKRRSGVIEEKLFDLEVFKNAQAVSFYVSTPTEVDTASMIDKALQLGKRVLVPLSHADKKEIDLYEIKDRTEDLELGNFGILEPRPGKTRPASLDELQCVIVPGVVFDKKNHRIGHGQGYYDRFLSKLGPQVTKIGLAFSFQVIEEIPEESHDEKLDLVVTD